jgi:hypothetical protein
MLTENNVCGSHSSEFSLRQYHFAQQQQQQQQQKFKG